MSVLLWLFALSFVLRSRQEEPKGRRRKRKPSPWKYFLTIRDEAWKDDQVQVRSAEGLFKSQPINYHRLQWFRDRIQEKVATILLFRRSVAVKDIFFCVTVLTLRFSDSDLFGSQNCYRSAWAIILVNVIHSDHSRVTYCRDILNRSVAPFFSQHTRCDVRWEPNHGYYTK